MIVVDCNILLYLLIEGEMTPVVEKLLLSHSEWVAPRLWKDEFCNVLCTLERRGKIQPMEALNLLHDAEEVVLESHEILPERIFSVSRQTGCSGYDSQYIALAEELGLRLYTYDQQILRAVPKVATRP